MFILKSEKNKKLYLARDIDKFFIDWRNSDVHKALKVIGARQVGKTTSIKNFAYNNYKNVIYLDLEDIPGRAFAEYIKTCSDSVTKVLPEYFEMKNIPFTNDKDTIIIFDEIQKDEAVWGLIRPINVYLDCDLIVTGSALSITDGWFQPAGNAITVKMHTMSFPEFINCYSGKIRKFYDLIDLDKITDKQREILQFLFNAYCKVGGYPAAINAYLDGRDYKEELKEILEILKTELTNIKDPLAMKKCIEDIYPKIIEFMVKEKKGDKNLLEHLTNSIKDRDSSLSITKFEVNTVIRWLREADVISVVNGFNLANDSESSLARFYFNDIGLLNYLAHQTVIDEGNLDGLLAETFLFKVLYNKDLLHVKYSFGFYNNYEYDLLLRATPSGDKKLVEIKHGSGRSRSMEVAIQKDLAKCYSFYFGDTEIRNKDGITYYPLYLADKTILDNLDYLEEESPFIKKDNTESEKDIVLRNLALFDL